jgi:hypothetical protein
MFHGIVKSAKGYWFRLITSAALLDGETVIEEFNSGTYHPAFLNTFFPGQFRVEVRKLSRKVFRFTQSAFPITGALFSSEVIRWSTASDQYMVRIRGNRGWLTSFKEIGLIIQNSKKMSKRLAEIVRTTSMWLYDPSGSIRVEVITNYVRESDVDGISAVSRSVFIRAIRSNTEASRSWRAKQIWKVVTGQTVVAEFRMLTPDGLIKGNALVLPKHMMNGYDVRTFPPNIKSEIRTEGWQWLTFNPSYGAIPVKSDDLTHSIYHRVRGLYDRETLLASLKGMLETFFGDLKEGRKSEWMTRLAEVDVLHQDAEEEFSSDKGLIRTIQERVAALSRLGVKLTASQTLMFLSVNGLKAMLLGKAPAGQVWKDKSRHWFPVPWAYAAHIMTKEALEIFGFDMPKGDHGFYHEATHCFVVPGEHFHRHLADHGGPDLDDTVKVHIRTINDGMVAFLLRNPNDFGEWSVIPVLEAGPVYHTYTDSPPVVDWNELFTAVPQFSWIKEDLEIGELPGSKNLTIGDVFSLEDEARVRAASIMFPAGTGGTVIPKMIHAALMGGHVQKQFASNEAIIDALQQGMATPEDIKVIQEYVDHIFNLIRKETGGEVDAFWAETRLFEGLMNQYGLHSGDASKSPWVALHQEREHIVRAALNDMVSWLNATVTKPEVLDQIRWTPEEMTAAPAELAKIKAGKSRSANWVEEFVKLLEESDAEFGEERTNRKILRLANEAFAAKAQWPRANHDQWLYSFSAKSEKQPVDWLIRALKAQTNR